LGGPPGDLWFRFLANQATLTHTGEALPPDFQLKSLANAETERALIEEAYDVLGYEPGDDEVEECLERAWTAGELRESIEEIAEGEEEITTWKPSKG